MKTECSYDYLFVYDGNSYSDNLLGSFSGLTLPDTVVATSGYVSISTFLFFSTADSSVVQGVAPYILRQYFSTSVSCDSTCCEHFLTSILYNLNIVEGSSYFQRMYTLPLMIFRKSLFCNFCFCFNWYSC